MHLCSKDSSCSYRLFPACRIGGTPLMEQFVCQMSHLNEALIQGCNKEEFRAGIAYANSVPWRQ